MKTNHENKAFEYKGEKHLFVAMTGEIDVYVASIAGVRVAVLTEPYTVQVSGHCVGVGRNLDDAFKIAVELVRQVKCNHAGRDILEVK